MKLSFSTSFSEDIYTIDVPDNTLISGLKSLISVKCGQPEHQFSLMKDGRLIDKPNTNIKSAGLRDGDLVLLVPALVDRSCPHSSITATPSTQSTTSTPPSLNFSNIRIGAPSTLPQSSPIDRVEIIRRSLLDNADLLPMLRQRNPEIAAALNDPVAFRRIYEAQNVRDREFSALESMSSVELDPTVQGRIAELIRQRNIDIQMETALEHYPETFTQVSMLYINCKVGRIPIKAFVDSGAQSTIMSEACARRCNLDSLIDRRWEGKAYGVGTQTIIGRVHNSHLEIGGAFLPTSFIVLKDQTLDLLLGLDMLRRHQCCIDLKRNVLTIGDNIVTSFLPESEIPASMHLPFSGTDDDLAGGSGSVQRLTQYSSDQRAKIKQLTDQQVPLNRAIQELQAHNWDVQNALISYMSSDDAP